ncbi:MAG: hypothetical protein JRF62_10610 [Deltaproteobacteria bacterium]|nr:hypothetical protein [Deltaproteobacteria bacterium]MBW2247623.1 hypothetical protein [Deltaproteobacteria bacterium]MBW2640230.1 hypothetical protein [Deltaproteobacteria bacterium]
MVPDIYFLEFFEDFLLRKMMVEPMEYVYGPPALKLFYRFLHEKGYLDNPEDMIRKIDKLEPYFIEVLRKQFSNDAILEKFPLIRDTLGGNTEIWDEAYFVETIG